MREPLGWRGVDLVRIALEGQVDRHCLLQDRAALSDAAGLLVVDNNEVVALGHPQVWKLFRNGDASELPVPGLGGIEGDAEGLPERRPADLDRVAAPEVHVLRLRGDDQRQRRLVLDLRLAAVLEPRVGGRQLRDHGRVLRRPHEDAREAALRGGQQPAREAGRLVVAAVQAADPGGLDVPFVVDPHKLGRVGGRAAAAAPGCVGRRRTESDLLGAGLRLR
mmetsp:Transcript_70432/g.199729  ORF Transcript_70432/g.199729 Transcript_70432/m.199729 type:complete len:221 (+) Transcript_70432:839-1501(+)